MFFKVGNNVGKPSAGAGVRSRVQFGGARISPVVPFVSITPVLLFIGIFIFLPVGYSFLLSIQDYRLGFSTSKFIGLDNYVELFHSDKFGNALKNSLIASTATSFFSAGIGLFLALQLSSLRKGKLFYQTVFFIPVTATMAAMAIVWRFIFHTEFGVMNALLLQLGLGKVSWLQLDATAMMAVILLSVWSSFGYALVLFLAGFAGIPRSIIEAATIDGAGYADRFWKIILPLISPTTIFVFVVMTVRALENFDAIRVLTDGGPATATQTLSHLLYQEGFLFFRTGFASAIAIVFFLLSMAISKIQLIAERWVHYE